MQDFKRLQQDPPVGISGAPQDNAPPPHPGQRGHDEQILPPISYSPEPEPYSSPRIRGHLKRRHFSPSSGRTRSEPHLSSSAEELPKDWNGASNILQLCSFDRPFVYPAEQLHILVCLKATKQDTEVITPFKVAAVISKNGNSAQNVKQQMDISDSQSTSNGAQAEANGTHEGAAGQGLEDQNDETMSTPEKMGPEQDISATESLPRMEDHKQRTETLLERFRKD